MPFGLGKCVISEYIQVVLGFCWRELDESGGLGVKEKGSGDWSKVFKWIDR